MGDPYHRDYKHTCNWSVHIFLGYTDTRKIVCTEWRHLLPDAAKKLASVKKLRWLFMFCGPGSRVAFELKMFAFEYFVDAGGA